MLYTYSFVVFCLFPQIVWANASTVVISELLWMGSDLSTADEWFELANTGSELMNIGGWKVTTHNGSGEEADMIVFPMETTIAPGDVLVVSNYGKQNGFCDDIRFASQYEIACAAL